LQKKIILIAGPTASGKSELAIKLSKKINGEIINADSMQVYKQFSILSSRPSKQQLKKAKHHLYGFLSVEKHFSTGHWLKLLIKKINNILKNKKIPIIVGGTGLYFNSIINGISKIPAISKIKRKQIRALHEKIGQKKFYEKLILIDPLSKNKFKSNDTQRTLRAYEVKLTTNKSIYEWALNTKSEFLDFDLKKFFLDTPRVTLLENIEKRTKLMIKNKCVSEVQNFMKLKIEKSLSANKIIGVGELTDYLNNQKSLKSAVELINIRTRQYAKRQKTWSRSHMKNWNKVYSKDLSILLKKILKLIS
tara:strand:- start:853 stop:1770 length:918 start_codon:yes stop_codon:yes gene_type:complete